ncbi:MAG: enoyl-CoA hydratase/isomerase family protein [Alphaproteobacteria bacterium]|nr:enoyl-CoA hydratase/isomerase family protein [Alphaproteobacteria bacterium]
MAFWTEAREGAVAIARFANEPRNTLTLAGVEELSEIVGRWERDETLRVAILTGASERFFVAHYDVGQLAEGSDRLRAPDAPGPSEELHLFNRVMLRLEALDKIVVAALNGQAMGGGFELALACDFRLARDGDWRYGLPETGVGIIPGAGGTQRMTRLVGVARALDLILHGRPLSPDGALALGLVSRVFPPETFWSSVMGFAANLAARAPIALREAKACVRAAAELPFTEGLRLEQAAFRRCMESEDANGAMRAYLDGKTFASPFGYPFKGR